MTTTDPFATFDPSLYQTIPNLPLQTLLSLVNALDAKLTAWVEKRYRDRLSPADLADPQLMLESQVALDELTTLLGLGSIYEFQL